MLFLSADDVEHSVTMLEAIDSVAAAYQEYSAGEAVVPLRMPIDVPDFNGISLVMPGHSPRSEAMGVKIISIYPDNLQQGIPTINALVIMLDRRTGIPVAAIEGGSLTVLRTGAASGVATRSLARVDASSAAVIGNGIQARSHLLAVCLVRPIRHVLAYDLIFEKARSFAQEMNLQLREQFGLDVTVQAVATASDAVRGADVVITTTTSKTPVIAANDLKEGAHINAIGSFTPETREIGEDTVLRAAKIVADSKEAVLSEAGDVIQPIRNGMLNQDAIFEIGDILNGKYPARESATEITLFKSVGIALLDVVVGNLVARQALVKGLGQTINL